MSTTVADVMTTQVVTLREEDNLTELQPDMEFFGLRHLPVVDGERLVGLLTHRDILRLTVSSMARDSVHQAIERDQEEGTFVAAVMKRDVITVPPTATIQEAARLMVDERVGCLPVVDAEQRLLGIVTEHDLLSQLVA